MESSYLYYFGWHFELGLKGDLFCSINTKSSRNSRSIVHTDPIYIISQNSYSYCDNE